VWNLFKIIREFLDLLKTIIELIVQAQKLPDGLESEKRPCNDRSHPDIKSKK
jgi:hypothetical protein